MMEMKLNKSTNHSKITGNFSEYLVTYWLSKYGFECAVIDHTGIDIIAHNPHTKEVMGISVKSRSRNTGTEKTNLSIPNENFKKVRNACDAFKCTPYFAIFIDAGNHIYLFLLSQKHLLKLHPKGQKTVSWKMKDAHLKLYENDPNIIFVRFEHEIIRWWKDDKKKQPSQKKVKLQSKPEVPILKPSQKLRHEAKKAELEFGHIVEKLLGKRPGTKTFRALCLYAHRPTTQEEIKLLLGGPYLNCLRDAEMRGYRVDRTKGKKPNLRIRYHLFLS